MMQGDATRNAAVEAALVARARALLVAAGWDDTSDPDRPEPRKFRRRPVGRVGPTARILRRINGSRRGRRIGRPARTSTDRDRGGNRTVGNPCRSRSPYLPGDRSFGICEPQTQRLKSGDLIVEAVRRGQAEPTTYQYGLLRQDLDPMCALRNQRISIRLRRSRSASVPPSGPACLSRSDRLAIGARYSDPLLSGLWSPRPPDCHQGHDRPSRLRRHRNRHARHQDARTPAQPPAPDAPAATTIPMSTMTSPAPQ